VAKTSNLLATQLRLVGKGNSAITVIDVLLARKDFNMVMALRRAALNG